MTLKFFASVAFGVFAGMSLASAQTGTPAALQRNDYTDPANWLCRPGRIDACTNDQTATIVNADGSEKIERWTADPNAPVDCFYIYPTVSGDLTPNSGMVPGAGEKSVVVQQVSRLASKCRVFVPMYRQMTLAALHAALSGKRMAADPLMTYMDIHDAWQEYLAHDNHGRGVVLIGHSQGSMFLVALVKNEIDGQPVQHQILSVILGGVSLQVPVGKDVGGDFKSIPLCRSPSQTECAIAFASYRADVSPRHGVFGQPKGEGMMAACVNPAALAGGEGDLDTYFPAGKIESEEPVEWVKGGQPITTPFVKVPGLLTGECVSNSDGSYLAVRLHASSGDRRTEDIGGDVIVNGRINADWGLHIVDMNLTMGNLENLIGTQSAAWLGAHPK